MGPLLPARTCSEGLRTSVRHTRMEDWYFSEHLLRDDDIWLASSPRSGSLFVRFILISARHYLQYGDFPGDLSGMKTIPDLHGMRLDLAEGSPRIIKTHFPYDPRYRRIIHLVRDPRDLIISYFHYSKGLPHLFMKPVPDHYKLPQFVDLFLDGKVWPGDLRAHTASYCNCPGDVAYTRIRYESLLGDANVEYRRLLNGAGIAMPDDALDKLIRHTSFANMKRLHKPDSARAGMVEGNPEYILRKGMAGQHKQVLRHRTRERLTLAFGDYMRTYNWI